MSIKKNILSLFALPAVMLVCMAASSRYADYRTKWVILKQCTVKVNGSTNVNKFTCIVPDYPNSDTLTCYIKSNNRSVVMAGHLALPVFSFDCANAMMTSDLRKTLHSKDFPTFYIHFISLEKYPLLKSEPELVKGIVNIELAGVKKMLEVNYKISMDDRKVIHLVGTQSIHFSDFNLTPPRKLGGMIRANDKLDVEFYVNFKLIDRKEF